ncbi:MAG TPA: type II toxin-antitoxin system HicB family antitoxin [Fimbriimonadaceae bacterium]|jgi:predicted RNase H-like HicB family nuclease
MREQLYIYTALYVPSEDWWAAKVVEIPGVVTQGKTLEEARENLQDALEQMLEILREEAEEFGKGASNRISEPIVLKAS